MMNSSTNPYQPPSDSDDQGRELVADEGKGTVFTIASAVLIVLGFLATVMTFGRASPLAFAAVLGTMRASALFARQQQTSGRRYSPVLLLFTSTVLTLLMMLSCVIAFATICVAGAWTTSAEFSVMLWVGLCTLAAMIAFIFLFIRSLRWSL
ncbi:MAG: hypothetical protein ACTHK7_23200 [Aureliella sp.]